MLRIVVDTVMNSDRGDNQMITLALRIETLFHMELNRG